MIYINDQSRENRLRYFIHYAFNIFKYIFKIANLPISFVFSQKHRQILTPGIMSQLNFLLDMLNILQDTLFLHQDLVIHFSTKTLPLHLDLVVHFSPITLPLHLALVINFSPMTLPLHLHLVIHFSPMTLPRHLDLAQCLVQILLLHLKLVTNM